MRPGDRGDRRTLSRGDASGASTCRLAIGGGLLALTTLLLGLLAALVAYGRRPSLPHAGMTCSVLQPAH